MKVIKLRKNLIDIPFENENGETILLLHFDRTDDNVKRLYESFETLQKKLAAFEAIEKEGKDPDFDEQKKFVKETCDSILGAGAFDKIYKLNPSVIIVASYLYQIAIGIKEELEEEDLKTVESKYLK